MNFIFSKKCIFTTFLLLNLGFMLSAQTGLKFNDIFNFTISGEKLGIIDVIKEKKFTVDKGTVVKISSSSISEISTFDKTPSVLSSSSQGMLFINNIPITNMPEANVPTVEFPIWLKAGIYNVKLVAHNNNQGKRLNGFINGLIYAIE